MDLETVLLAYGECALWSSTDNADESGGEPLDRNYGWNDIHPDTLVSMREDCAAFLAECEELAIANGADNLTDWLANASDASEYASRAYSTEERFGHDFWLTRNGHGAGFWDRGLGKIGTLLTDAAHVWGSVDLYVGDDGLIHA